MAFIPEVMDSVQIAFLANEITKSYMTGKNISSQEAFARAYFNMYQQSMEIIAEEQRKKMNEPIDVQAIMDEAANEERPYSKLFR